MSVKKDKFHAAGIRSLERKEAFLSEESVVIGEFSRLPDRIGWCKASIDAWEQEFWKSVTVDELMTVDGFFDRLVNEVQNFKATNVSYREVSFLEAPAKLTG